MRVSLSAPSLPLLLSSAGLLLVMAVPRSAQAYCTLHTCQDVSQAQADQSMGRLEPKECEREESCIVEGYGLFWDSPCLSFGVSSLNTSALGLTPDEFHDIIADAYKMWEGVECPGGGNPGFHVNSVGVVQNNGNFFCEAEPEANVSIWSLVNRWTRASDALGYTSSVHNKNDGEIFDADVELNLKKIEREHEGNYAIVLGRIAVHEAGHYLGLAHSRNRDAVMYDSYGTYELLTRELTQDDIDGICELYPPKKDALQCSQPGYVEAGLDQVACEEFDRGSGTEEAASACSIQAVGGRGGSPWLSAALFAALFCVAAGRKRTR
jgi:hypothetical protein